MSNKGKNIIGSTGHPEQQAFQSNFNNQQNSYPPFNSNDQQTFSNNLNQNNQKKLQNDLQATGYKMVQQNQP